MDMKPIHDEIALRAYQLWEKDGRQQGRDREYWFRAEAELTARGQPSGKAVTAQSALKKASFTNPIPVPQLLKPQTFGSKVESIQPISARKANGRQAARA